MPFSLATERDPPVGKSFALQTLERGRHRLQGTFVIVRGVLHERLVIVRWRLALTKEAGEEGHHSSLNGSHAFAIKFATPQHRRLAFDRSFIQDARRMNSVVSDKPYVPVRPYHGTLWPRMLNW